MTANTTQRLKLLLASVLCSPVIALGNADTVIVDCSRGASIGAALGKKNPDRPLAVVIKGACAETVLITRDDTALIGDGGTVNGTINIVGAKRVFVRTLTLSSPTGPGISASDNAAVTVEDSILDRNGTEGITVRNGAHATVQRSSLSNNGVAAGPDSGRGIDVRHHGSVDARNNNISNNRADGVGVFNDGYVRLQENTIEGNGRLAAGEAGVQVNRARVRANGNIIRNNTGIAAIILTNHGDYRTGTGLNAVDFPDNEFAFERIEHAVGPGLVTLDASQASYGDFRQVHIVGSISVGDHTMVQVRGDQVGPNTPCSTINSTGGFVSVSGRFGLLRLRATQVTPGAIG